ncbi:hypothetical protein SPI_02546 [Niveomyces insectorum RCEF 264]|uniref:Uncharacterized protein n=1 Tax=Niveomyces insectorum RCEF 264 TaxID=1081102 RepID=A0A167Y2R3_9HYPO|nr:hypothetical protein SPI_02546 [Niveomyces insectorum RCEF 264]
MFRPAWLHVRSTAEAQTHTGSNNSNEKLDKHTDIDTVTGPGTTRRGRQRQQARTTSSAAPSAAPAVDDDRSLHASLSTLLLFSPLSPRCSLLLYDAKQDDDKEEDTEEEEAHEEENGTGKRTRYEMQTATLASSRPLPLPMESAPSNPTWSGPAFAGRRATSASARTTPPSSSPSPSLSPSSSPVRRFWSPTPSSPPSSPPPSSRCTSPTWTPGTSATAVSTAPPSTGTTTTTRLAGTARFHPKTRAHAVTYIPPLMDGASGTMPGWLRASRRQRSRRLPGAEAPAGVKTILTICYLLWEGIRWLVGAAPGLLHDLAALVTVPQLRSLDDLYGAAETMLQLALGVFLLTVLAAATVLWLCLPGGLFAAWLGVCWYGLRVASWPLNVSRGDGPTVYHGPWAGDIDPDVADGERWFFVSGMGATYVKEEEDNKVFGRPITVIRPGGRTYGAVADGLSALAQRLLLPLCELPARGTDAVYVAVRQALLRGGGDDPPATTATTPGHRVVVLAHNTGATVVAQALARLHADLPAARLARLEIYTFGSLAPDFAVPSNAAAAAAIVDGAQTALVPHMEHVAHARDACARFGVLRSVHADSESRYCGGLFVLGGGGGGGGGRDQYVGTATAAAAIPYAAPRRSVFSIEDYLAALFGPEPWSMRPDVVTMDGAGVWTADADHLEAPVVVDRELAERREMAAMASAALPDGGLRGKSRGSDNGGNRETSSQLSSSAATARLSWTGLGATAAATTALQTGKKNKRISSGASNKDGASRNRNSMHIDTEGLAGLEAVRRLCRASDGRPVRDVSRLAGYFSGTVSRHRERYGF